MQFKIYSAHRETGHDVVVVVDAPDEQSASEFAAAMGLLITHIEPVPPSVPVGAADDSANVNVAPRQPTLPNPKLMRSLRAMLDPKPPDYFWLKALGRVYFYGGAVICIVALCLGILMLLGFADQSARAGSASALIVGGALSLVGSVIWILLGLFSMAVGQAILAFRDIARNSWSLPRIERVLSAE